MRARGRPGDKLAWLGALLALYLAVPVVAFAIRLVGSRDRGFGQPGLWDALGVSLRSATIATLIVIVLGIPLAHWLACASGPLATVVGVVVQLPLALPPVMSGIMLIYVVGPYTRLGTFFRGALTDSVTGIVLAQTFVAAPFLIIAARSAFAAVDPGLEDRAAALGHGPLRRFWRVSLPVAAPGIRAGVLLTFLRAIGEYGATVLLAYNPFSLPVYTYVEFSGTGIPPTQAPTALALAAALVVVLVNVVRLPRRLRSQAILPAPRTPAATAPTTVSFDLDVDLRGFRLRLAHSSTSNRIAILGPSGSGKSVTLRSLAGLFGPQAGTVAYGDQVVSDVPTERRRIGFVPQGLELFPHRTVWQQVCFARDADERVAAWWLHALRLDGLEDRLPGQLSGGQRQRVSFAQALAHGPRLVLLDEPFSSLDAPVRAELRRELRRLQHDTGLSTVLVTHDPVEAALLADEILVIDEGRLLQAGPRQVVYNRPASPEVARLLGIDNLAHATVVSDSAIAAGDVAVATTPHGLPEATEVLWCVHPDHVGVGRTGAYRAVIVDVADLGTRTALTVRLHGGPELRVRASDDGGFRVGDHCQVDIDPAAITLWPRHGDVSTVETVADPR